MYSSLLFAYTDRDSNIIKSLVPKTQLPKLPQITFTNSDESVPVDGHMVVESKVVNQQRRETFSDGKESYDYVIFTISRCHDLVKNFQIDGPLLQNIDKCQLTVGRHVISSTDDVKSPLNPENWFPTPGLVYDHLSLYARLIDVNGPTTGSLKYTACYLPSAERRQIASQKYLRVEGYDMVFHKGSSMGEFAVNVLRNEFPFVTKIDFSTGVKLGSVKISDHNGRFNRAGDGFNNVVVRTNKPCKFNLTVNDTIILTKHIEPDTNVRVTNDSFFVYPVFQEVTYCFVLDDCGPMKDFVCSVERDEYNRNSDLTDSSMRYLIPELGLILVNGTYSDVDTHRCFLEKSMAKLTRVEEIN